MRITKITQYSTFIFILIGCGLAFGWPEQEYEEQEYEEPEQPVYEHERHAGPETRPGNRRHSRQMPETQAQPQNTELERQYSELEGQLQKTQKEKAELEGKKSELEEQLQRAQDEKGQLEEQKSKLEEQLQRAQDEKGQLEEQKSELEEQLQKAQGEKKELEGQSAVRDARIHSIALIAGSCALFLILIGVIFKRMNRARAMYKQSHSDKNTQAEEELRCPYCGWKHKATDEVCKNCHTRF